MTDVYTDTWVIVRICVGKAPVCAAVCSVSTVSTAISHIYHNMISPVNFWGKKIVANLFSEGCFFIFFFLFSAGISELEQTMGF